ncbi:hypothetical protein E5288_WYG009870 [Bos mutus]|uniref:Uncharacterized protein n=1 Tax=Bos mutus TaxID=72004 RepID=A0A6B0RSN4_9CETA|nr:hypothetical protein [Bos mutus]
MVTAISRGHKPPLSCHGTPGLEDDSFTLANTTKKADPELQARKGRCQAAYDKESTATPDQPYVAASGSADLDGDRSDSWVLSL